MTTKRELQNSIKRIGHLAGDIKEDRGLIQLIN